MRVQSVVSWIVAVGALTSWSPRAAVGQQLAIAAQTPRFFYAPSTTARPVEVDVSRNAVLGQVVSLELEHSTIGGLLAEIQRQTGLTFAYDPHFPATRPVTLEAGSITVAGALGAILVGTGVDVVLTPTGHVWLTDTRPLTAPAQEGTIVGRVTVKRTDDPIVGATVTLDPARRSAATGTDGRYRFANLSPGSYTVRARYIGYRALVASVTVSANQEMTVDFPLVKSAQQLEEVVTTGTVIPTEVKALPTPVSVITTKDIEQQHPQTVAELFRQAVPGAVGWNYPSIPSNTTFSVRGANTLSGVSQMKVFVDGVESASPGNAPVDLNSIARIEVIRGPQAAAIYGSDAIGGVIQIFTKRGDPTSTRPQVGGEVGLGLVETPYAGYGGVLRQDYKASVHGGGPDLSYNFGGGYRRIGDYLPNGEISRQSNPSVYGGIHLMRGIITADVSGRYFTNDVPNVYNPDLLQAGYTFFSKPNYQPTQVKNETVGARLSVAPTGWWLSTLTMGIDRLDEGWAQRQPRLTTSADTLLTIFDHSRTKTSVGFNSSVQGALASNVSASLTAGFDHYNMPDRSFFTSSALTTTGTIRIAPGGFSSESRSIINNTGYFAQAQVGFRDALFLTGGVRAEQNSEFGDSLGTPLSPRVGASYAVPIGQATIKVRSSWGKAIRPPSPGRRSASVSQLANPELGPERQRGWDAGIDAAFGRRGSLSFSYYDQTADNLIQFVQVQATPLTFQYQNVGRVKNTGVELEGTLGLGPLQLKAQYGFARSRVEELGPNYTGNLIVGDQALLTPKHVAGASVTITPLSRTTVVAGLTYVGSWTYTDFLAQYRCLGGTGPCQTGPRGYLIMYPGFVKLNAGVSQQITPFLSGFIAVDNLTNNTAFEFYNLSAVMGRITTVGFRAHN